MVQCDECKAEFLSDEAFCTTCGKPRAGPGPVALSTVAASLDTVAPPSTQGPPPPPTFARPPLETSRTRGETVDGRPGSAVIPRVAIEGNELLGQATPNTVYVGQRLQYEKQRDLEELDPLKNVRYYAELAFHAFICFGIWWLGLIPLAIIGVILGLINHTFGTVVAVLLFLAWSFVMACVYWLRKLPGQLSEWKFEVDGKGAVAPVVFDHIAWSFTRRETPIDFVRSRRFSLEGQRPLDFLEVRRGIFYGLVSCFPYGEDLYVGWTFWLYLSPARFLWIGIRRIVWELQFRGHGLYTTLQFDRAKAFREAIHSSVREGVDVATGQLDAQGQGTVGTVVPIVTDDSINFASQASPNPVV